MDIEHFDGNVNLNPFQVEVSPLENAVSVVENKNQELRTLISRYQLKQPHSNNVNLLSMTLNGVVDAAVNGGIARYQEVGGAICQVTAIAPPPFLTKTPSVVLFVAARLSLTRITSAATRRTATRSRS